MSNYKEISDTMKQIKKNLKKNKSIEELLNKNEYKKGGAPFFDPYNIMKQYLDKIFVNENQLKKEQEDSLERLTKIREYEKIKDDEEKKQQDFEEENSMLAKNEENFQKAKENAKQIEDKAEIVKQETDEALKKLEDANKEVSDSQSHVNIVESNNKIVEDAIRIKKENIKNADNIMQNILKKMNNKELVSLEETNETIEENDAINEIKQLSISNVLEKKNDDLLI
uniref:Uncharacterized protein n=1 Tax=viral metagenome TaxID=1070528 RepID=A0A6C0HYJ5_9ZZZZ